MLFNPKMKAHGSYENDALKLIDENTPFAIREAFGSLYTNLLYLPIADKCKKIAITSAYAGEGKTYVAVNLAITLAKNSDNKKILLVDMDMRKPRISRLFKEKYHKHDKKNGLSEYLAGIDDVPNIVETDIPNLSVVFSGAESASPANLINSARMSVFFEACSEEYDFIIIDTPPVNLVSDAVLLSHNINGYVLSSRSGYSNTNALGDAIETLSKVEAQIFGIVLTGVEPKGSGAYGLRKKYSSYGSYGYYSKYGSYGGYEK